MTKSITVTHWKVVGVGEETLKKVLMSSGLTEKEAEVYIFLAKHEALKGGEIAKLLKKDKAQVFRLLKSLQAKGVVEATLEFPTRFTAVPFETVIESNIKLKREEVDFIEKAKKDLLRYLRKKREAELESSVEKFVVIEGKSKIFSRINQMIKDTNHQLSTTAAIPDLVHVDQPGIIDAAFNHPLKHKIQFRFLTEFSEQDLNAVKTILKKAPTWGSNFKARNPDLGLRLFPRMIIRDDEEILFFIAPTKDASAAEHNDLCLWTNCKSLVQAFTAVFEDLWRNSTDIQTKIMEIETGTPTPKTYIISNAEAAKKMYEETVKSAKEEIIMITSSKELIGYWKNTPLLKEWTVKGISVKIMAPIISENLEAAEQLSKIFAVRHVPVNYLKTTIVDGKHLFQLKTPPSEKKKLEATSHFENTFYTDDFEYVEKMKATLNDIWENAAVPSTVTLKSILREARQPPASPPSDKKSPYDYFGKITGFHTEKQEQRKMPTEKEVLDKIIKAKKFPQRITSKGIINKWYGSLASAIIHPPAHFNLPDLQIMIYHLDKQSTFGAEDAVLVFLWLETPAGHGFVPVAKIGDSAEALAIWQVSMAGTPAAQNLRVVKKDEIQVRVHGNTLFAGWTVPIPLLPPYVLPPACILFEGYGKARTDGFTVIMPSGYGNKLVYNSFDAFVTFFHPSSKYSGPGTDGFLGRDVVATSFQPSTTHVNK